MSEDELRSHSHSPASDHRALFSYLTADAADDYIAIMRLFTGTLLAHAVRRDQLVQPGDPRVPPSRPVVGDPEPEVGVATLVARPRVDERA